jgi:hypothetical protein
LNFTTLTFRPRPWATTSPETFARLSAFSPEMTWPSRLTSSTDLNSTAAPFSPGSF